MLFKSITPSNKSKKNNFGRIIFIKIIIIKANTAKVYSNKAHTITKECSNIKACIIICEYNIIKFYKNFIYKKTNQEQVSMLAGKHQKLCYIFLKSFIYQDNIITQNVLWKQLYHIFLESYINQEQNQIQKDKYQQLYHIFFSLKHSEKTCIAERFVLTDLL